MSKELDILKKLRTSIFMMGFAICSHISLAQLSGTYTIGTTGAEDYAGFTAAMTDMVSNGINGDIVFEVQPDVYQERVIMNFNDVTFSSTDISVSFAGQGTEPGQTILIFQSTNSGTDYTLQVNGGQNISFQNIKFQNAGLIYANVVGVGLDASVDGISFDNCEFQGLSNYEDGTFPTSIYFESGTTGISVTNSIVRGSNYGITCWSGTSDVLIQNNELYNQFVQAMSLSISNALIDNNFVEKVDDSFDEYNYGIEVWGGSDFVISNNRLEIAYANNTGIGLNDDFVSSNISNDIIDNTITISSTPSGIGISNTSNTTIRSNTLTVQSADNGIEVSGGTLNLVENNDLDYTTVTDGINLSSCSSCTIIRNTATMQSVDNGFSITNSTNAMVINNFMILNDVNFGGILSGANEAHFLHNTLKMDSDGSVLVVVSGDNIKSYNNIMINYGEGRVYSSLGTFSSDYNLVYTVGEEFSSDDDTFEEHQNNTGQDEHSSSQLIEFPIADSPEICHYSVADSGLDLSTITNDGSDPVTDDYSGNVRNTMTPDIGAHEFNLPGTVIFSADTVAICEGTTLNITPENSFVEYLWLPDSATESFKEGSASELFKVEVTDDIGCILIDSMYLDVQVVEVDLGEDRILCEGAPLFVAVEEEYHSYLWSTSQTTQEIQVLEPGDLSVEVSNELGCTASDMINVRLSDDVIVPNFLFSGVGCTADTIQFVEVSDIEPDSVYWEFGDGDNSKEQHPAHLYGAVGDYMVNMTVSLGECHLDLTKEIVITSTCPDYLVAYYPLDTAANDISDNEFHGELFGDLGFVQDEQRDEVAVFDGVDDYIELTTSAALDLVNTSFTVSAWIKSSSIDGSQPILGTSVTEANQGLNLGIVDGKATLSFYENEVSGTQHIPADEWHFVTYVYDAEASQMIIYVDGEQDALAINKSPFIGQNIVTIGSAQGTLYKGAIDDLRIWKEVLTPDEIFENFSGYDTEFVGLYDLSSDATDTSGKGFDGTLFGDVSFVQDEERGMVAKFDGNGDYIQIGTATDQSITESSFVVSAWIKVNEFSTTNLSILGTDEIGSSLGLHLLLRQQNPYFGFYANDTRDNSTSIQTGEWYHLSFIYDLEAQTQSIYVNGQLTATGSNKSSFLGTGKLNIGRSLNANYFNGYIDDLRIRKIHQDAESGRTIEPIDEIEEDLSMVVYPNPSPGIATIHLKNVGVYNAVVNIYDLQGNLVSSQDVSGWDDIELKMDLSGLEQGLYFVQLANGDVRWVERLIIRSN